MKNKKSETDDLLRTTSRRGFLQMSGAGAVTAGAAAVLATEAETVEAATATPEVGKDKGYRETDHIKRYYELAKFI